MLLYLFDCPHSVALNSCSAMPLLFPEPPRAQQGLMMGLRCFELAFRISKLSH